jgi:hypothetical protein
MKFLFQNLQLIPREPIRVAKIEKEKSEKNKAKNPPKKTKKLKIFKVKRPSFGSVGFWLLLPRTWYALKFHFIGYRSATVSGTKLFPWRE